MTERELLAFIAGIIKSPAYVDKNGFNVYDNKAMIEILDLIIGKLS